MVQGGPTRSARKGQPAENLNQTIDDTATRQVGRESQRFGIQLRGVRRVGGDAGEIQHGLRDTLIGCWRRDSQRF